MTRDRLSEIKIDDKIFDDISMFNLSDCSKIVIPGVSFFPICIISEVFNEFSLNRVTRTTTFVFKKDRNSGWNGRGFPPLNDVPANWQLENHLFWSQSMLQDYKFLLFSSQESFTHFQNLFPIVLTSNQTISDIFKTSLNYFGYLLIFNSTSNNGQMSIQLFAFIWSKSPWLSFWHLFWFHSVFATCISLSIRT